MGQAEYIKMFFRPLPQQPIHLSQIAVYCYKGWVFGLLTWKHHGWLSKPCTEQRVQTIPKRMKLIAGEGWTVNLSSCVIFESFIILQDVSFLVISFSFHFSYFPDFSGQEMVMDQSLSEFNKWSRFVLKGWNKVPAWWCISALLRATIKRNQNVSSELWLFEEEILPSETVSGFIAWEITGDAWIEQL